MLWSLIECLSFVAETLGAAFLSAGPKRWGWCLVVAGILCFIPSFMERGFEFDGLLKETNHQTATIDQLNEKIDRLNRTTAGLLAQLPHVEETGPRPKPTTAQLSIQAPAEGSKVAWRASVAGSIADPNAIVWLVVHPMDVSAYWVQAAVNVKQDGRWNGSVYLGRVGDIDSGKQFEILALANPTEPIKEGTIAGGWPKAQWYSDMITVVRK